MKLKMSDHTMRIVINYEGPFSEWQITQRCGHMNDLYQSVECFFTVTRSSQPWDVKLNSYVVTKLVNGRGVLHYQDDTGVSQAFEVSKLAGSSSVHAHNEISLATYDRFESRVTCARTVSTDTLQSVLANPRPLHNLLLLVPYAKVELNGDGDMSYMA